MGDRPRSILAERVLDELARLLYLLPISAYVVSRLGLLNSHFLLLLFYGGCGISDRELVKPHSTFIMMRSFFDLLSAPD